MIFPNRVEWSGNSKIIFRFARENRSFLRIVYFFYLRIVLAFLTVPVFFVTIINYFILNLNDESFVLVSPILYVKIFSTQIKKNNLNLYVSMWCLSRLPFNSNSWSGYLFAYAMQCLEEFASLLNVGPLISLFCGSCWVLASMGKDLTNNLAELNKSGMRKANRSKVASRFCNIFERFTKTKQLSKYLLNTSTGKI